MLLWSVASENLAIDISSVEVAPFFCLSQYILGACRNGATSTGRNSQLNPQQPEQMHAPLFLVLDIYSMFTALRSISTQRNFHSPMEYYGLWGYKYVFNFYVSYTLKYGKCLI